MSFSFGHWWYTIGIALLLLLSYGAGAAGPFGRRGGRRLLGAAALLTVVAIGLLIFSEDAPRIFEWIGNTLREKFGG